MAQRLLSGLAALTLAAPALAFHDGGVASCDGCHVMHEGADGGTIAGELLAADNPTDLCLSCHADGAGRVLGSDPLAPPPELGAGNFVFLLEDNLNDAEEGGLNPILGERAGHNVVAPGHGLIPDSRNLLAPGGTFPASRLGCTSCHDPHGRDTFRLLWGAGPVQGGEAQFAYAAPEAAGIAIDGPGESRTNHSAYRSGMSDWCRNCHGAFHDDGSPTFEHQSDQALSFDIVEQYNSYAGDDWPPGSFADVAYLPEVPFEDPTTTLNSTTGPTMNSRVMCLTCHRAHATSAAWAGRWDFTVLLLDADGEESGSHPIPNPYPGPTQGTLCTKCHGPEASEGFGVSP